MGKWLHKSLCHLQESRYTQNYPSMKLLASLWARDVTQYCESDGGGHRFGRFCSLAWKPSQWSKIETQLDTYWCPFEAQWIDRSISSWPNLPSYCFLLYVKPANFSQIVCRPDLIEHTRLPTTQQRGWVVQCFSASSPNLWQDVQDPSLIGMLRGANMCWHGNRPWVWH